MVVPRNAIHEKVATGIKDGIVVAADLASNAVTQAKVADDAIGAAELKVVVRDVTIAAEADSGTVTNAADINGVIIGVVPKSAVGSAVESAAITAVSGKIDVALVSAQAAETPGVVSVVVLQA